MNELPSDWVTRRLVDVAEVIMGQSPPGSTYNKSGAGVPFFQGKAEFGSKHPTVRQWTTAGTKFARAGDVLMSVRAPVGPTNIADQDCAIGRGLAAIRAGSQLNQSYLIWYLKHVEASIQSRGKGTTFDAISGNDLRDTPVNLPPLDQQRRIVEVLEDRLSQLDSTRTSIASQRASIHALRRSLLNKAFNGELGTR
jgi:type I restriction enzyme S subunit